MAASAAGVGRQRFRFAHRKFRDEQVEHAIVVSSKLTSLQDIRNIPIVLRKQNTSGLTDAFHSVQSGFSNVGNALHALGTNQAVMQGELQYMNAIQGLTSELFADSAKLANV